MIDANHQPLTKVAVGCLEVCGNIGAKHHGAQRTMLTAPQSRAARGLLSWSQVQLAEAAHVSIGTVRNFEAGRATPIVATLNAIQKALEDAGVNFLDQNGVKLRPNS